MAKRRTLHFDDLDQVMPEVDLLLRGYSRGGNWTLAQVCHHLALMLRGTVEGWRWRMPWISRRTVGALVAKENLFHRQDARRNQAEQRIEACPGVKLGRPRRGRIPSRRDWPLQGEHRAFSGAPVLWAAEPVAMGPLARNSLRPSPEFSLARAIKFAAVSHTDEPNVDTPCF